MGMDRSGWAGGSTMPDRYADLGDLRGRITEAVS